MQLLLDPIDRGRDVAGLVRLEIAAACFGGEPHQAAIGKAINKVVAIKVSGLDANAVHHYVQHLCPSDHGSWQRPTGVVVAVGKNEKHPPTILRHDRHRFNG